jgi:hypothetical protein
MLDRSAGAMLRLRFSQRLISLTRMGVRSDRIGGYKHDENLFTLHLTSCGIGLS